MPKSSMSHIPSLNDDTQKSAFLEMCCYVQVAMYMISNCGQTLFLQSEALHFRLVVRRGTKNVQEISYFLKISSICIGSQAKAEAKVYFLKMCARWNGNIPKCCVF